MHDNSGKVLNSGPEDFPQHEYRKKKWFVFLWCESKKYSSANFLFVASLSLSLSLSIDLAPSKRRKIGDVKHDDVCTNNVSVLRFFLLRELFKFH